MNRSRPNSTRNQRNSKFPPLRAKGICFSGYFESNGRGVVWSKAEIFPVGRVPITGRFSLAGGQPYFADAPQTTRGMAILFKLPDGEEWRTAMINLPVFTVRTAQEFHDQLLAFAPERATGKADPAKTKAFLAKYPEAAKAMQLIAKRPISSGFDNSTYNSLNAFRFINASGVVTPVRWSMVPVQPFEPISTTEPAKANKDYLFDALIASIHGHPLQWHLVVTIGPALGPDQ
jgi:catalase